jgi:hypothetical protein
MMTDLDLVDEMEIALECDDRDRIDTLWVEMLQRAVEARPDLAAEVRKFEEANGHPPGFFDEASPTARAILLSL